VFFLRKKTQNEVIRMSEQDSVKPASLRQMAYIRRLSTELGECEIEVSEGMSSLDASRIISELIVKVGKSGATNGRIKVNEPRLGMTMKECFRYWTSLGRDVLGDRRSAFILEVIGTYELFTEIAENVERGTYDCNTIEYDSEGTMEAESAA